MDKQPSKKDFWDKLDISAKFFNAVIIALLTIIIGIGTTRVANSISYGELTQKLIEGLAKTDTNSHVRRDLSLITLNGTIGDDNPGMLADMAEVIYLSDTTSQNEKSVARKILQQRDVKRYNSIMSENLKNRAHFLLQPGVRSSVVSLPNATVESIPQAKIVNTDVKEVYKTLVGSAVSVVYIQTNKDKSQLKSFASDLISLKYEVPGIDEVGDKFTKNSVRYFNIEDAAKAAEVAQLVFGKKLTDSIPPVQKFKNPDNQIPVGQIEVWIYQK